MPTTSVYLPDRLIEELDHLAVERGISRSRLIVESCVAMVEAHRASWPDGYLDGGHLSAAEARELRQSYADFTERVLGARRSRDEAPF